MNTPLDGCSLNLILAYYHLPLLQGNSYFSIEQSLRNLNTDFQWLEDEIAGVINPNFTAPY